MNPFMALRKVGWAFKLLAMKSDEVRGSRQCQLLPYLSAKYRYPMVLEPGRIRPREYAQGRSIRSISRLDFGENPRDCQVYHGTKI